MSVINFSFHFFSNGDLGVADRDVSISEMKLEQIQTAFEALYLGSK